MLLRKNVKAWKLSFTTWQFVQYAKRQRREKAFLSFKLRNKEASGIELWTWHFSWNAFWVKSCGSFKDKNNLEGWTKLFSKYFDLIGKGENSLSILSFSQISLFNRERLQSTLLLSPKISASKKRIFFLFNTNPTGITNSIWATKTLSYFEGNLREMFVRLLATDMMIFFFPDKLSGYKTFQFPSTRNAKKSLCKKVLPSSYEASENWAENLIFSIQSEIIILIAPVFRILSFCWIRTGVISSKMQLDPAILW